MSKKKDPQKIRQGSDRIAFTVISHIFLVLLCVTCVVPFWTVITASFTGEQTLTGKGYSLWFRDFSTEAYQLALKTPKKILMAYGNTIFVTVVGTFFATLLSTMTGYVLQHKSFKWRNGFSFYFFFTMLFNGGLVPWYILCMRYLKFKNSYLALILPMMFSVWYTMIAKNYLRDIPYEISESAKIDGANDLQIYFKIILPMAKPLLATLALFAALEYWNDWYNCMLFISDTDKQTLQYFLQQMLASVTAMQNMATVGTLASQQLPSESLKMAMTLIATGPIILVYPFVQKYFVQGLTVGAVKG